jgi:hypothetical protein
VPAKIAVKQGIVLVVDQFESRNNLVHPAALPQHMAVSLWLTVIKSNLILEALPPT